MDPTDTARARILKCEDDCDEQDRKKAEKEPCQLFVMQPCCGLKKEDKKKICKVSKKKLAMAQRCAQARANKVSLWTLVGAAVRGVSAKAFNAINNFADRGHLPDIESKILLESALTIAEKIRDREVTMSLCFVRLLKPVVSAVFSCRVDV